MSWIALRDVVRAVFYILEADALRGPINMVAPNPVTNAEFTRALGRALHRPAIIPAPRFALRSAFGEMTDAALLASTRAVPDRLLQSGFTFELPEHRGCAPDDPSLVTGISGLKPAVYEISHFRGNDQHLSRRFIAEGLQPKWTAMAPRNLGKNRVIPKRLPESRFATKAGP